MQKRVWFSRTALRISSASAVVSASTFSVNTALPVRQARRIRWVCSLVALQTATPSMAGSSRISSTVAASQPSFSAHARAASSSGSQTLVTRQPGREFSSLA